MKKILLMSILFVSFFSNCTKENNESGIVIEYELSDDVSPVNINFSVENDLHWSEWIINNSHPQQSESDNSFEYLFEDSGISNVKINASGINGEKYSGNLDIEIPQVADKLVIYGYSFENEYDFNINDDNLILKFEYYNGTAFSIYSLSLSADNFENNNSIQFENPIEIDISGFQSIIEDVSLYIRFTIEGTESHNRYFAVHFRIKEWYYHHRLYAPNYIYIDYTIGNNPNRIKFSTDWTKY